MDTALTKLQKDIKARNKRFAKLTKAQKRVAIASDVLTMLEDGKIKATHLVYVDLKKSGQKLLSKSVGKDLSELLPVLPTCNVCALGSMFMATVGRADNMKVEGPLEPWGAAVPDVNGCAAQRDSTRLAYNTHTYLEKYFTYNQLEAIEAAFESADTGSEYGYKVLNTLKGLDARGRMEAIMRNIIKNKGVFKPLQLV